MHPEELFNKHEYWARITIHRMFPEPNTYAMSKGLQIDDLYQFARIGLWNGCKSFDETKGNGTFRGHAIRNIKWYVLRAIQIQNSKFQYYKSRPNDDENRVNVLSINAKLNWVDSDELTYEDVLSSDNIYNFESTNPEAELFSSFGEQEILRVLKPKDKELVQMRVDGLTYQEIANYYCTSRQNIQAKLKRIQRKLNTIGVVC